MLVVGIPKETYPHERRVAATPETITKMVKGGMQIMVERDAGILAGISNDHFQQAGATIIAETTDLYKTAQVILKVQPPSIDTANNNEAELLRAQSVLIAPFLARQPNLIPCLMAKQITAFSLERIPRIARAQSMDMLSAMSNLAGYKSVILAADYLPKIFPMLTTAAGTILPAKVIVIGAGVAGLQAIATARRLGGVVIAFDTRPAALAQVKSLGAEFVSLETTHDAEDQSGYARAQTAAFYAKEQAIIQKYIHEADVVITTALIPNQRAPILITEDMVKTMKPGSVIVDLAIEQEGNCTLTEMGKITIHQDITIIGLTNLPSLMPVHASQLYARNVFAFLNHISASIPSKQWDLSDDIIKSCLIFTQT